MPVDILAELEKRKTPHSNGPRDILSEIKNPKNDEAIKAENLRTNHPYIYKGAEFLSKHPSLGKGVEMLANPASKINEFVESSGLPEFSGGLLEGLGNIPISLGNLPLQALGMATGKDHRVPHFDLSKKLEGGGGFPFEAGSLASNFIPGAAAIKGISTIARPNGYAGILTDILKGAGAGFALGEDKEGDRTLGSLLGGLFGGIHGLTNKSIGTRFEKKTKELSQELGDKYRSIFNRGSESGVITDLPKGAKFDRIIKNTSPDAHQSILDAIKNPHNIENLHWAQSDLGKIIENLKPRAQAHKLSSNKMEMYKEAINARKRIRGEMVKGFNNANRTDLANEYSDLTKRYGLEFIPRVSKDTQKIVDKLLNKKDKTKLFPELKAKEFGKNVLKGTGLVLGAGAVSKGIEKGINYFGDEY